MHNAVSIISYEKLCLNYHHRLIHFPYKKREFLQLTAATFQKMERLLHPPPQQLWGGGVVELL